MRTIDLNYLQNNDSISANDANALHRIFCQKSGITDPDEIVKLWNEKSPELPWGEDGRSPYVDHLTGLVVMFMISKIGGDING